MHVCCCNSNRHADTHLASNTALSLPKSHPRLQQGQRVASIQCSGMFMFTTFRPPSTSGCSRVRVSRCGIDAIAVVAFHERIHRGGGDAAAVRARDLDVALVAPVRAPRVLRAGGRRAPRTVLLRSRCTKWPQLEQSRHKTAHCNATHTVHEACRCCSKTLLSKTAGKAS